ncbi:MAG: hypothetical protein ACRDA3_15395 [Peptostreptococcaceae bacterium]
MNKLKDNIKIVIIILITLLIIIASSIAIHNNIDKIKSNDNSSKQNINIEKFDIYYQDSDYNGLILSSIEVDKNKSIIEKLKIISNEISKELFENRVIEVLKIENNIAYINLKDDGINNSWYNTFQGSTGASITAYGLLENFLQKEYTGKWIDGVYLTYNKEAPEMDHMGIGFFGSIIYREAKH